MKFLAVLFLTTNCALAQIQVVSLDQIDLDAISLRPKQASPTLAPPKHNPLCPCEVCNCGEYCPCGQPEYEALVAQASQPRVVQDDKAFVSVFNRSGMVNGSRRDMPIYDWAQPGGNGSPIAPLMEKTSKPRLTQAEADAALLALNQPVRKAVKAAVKIPGAAVKGAGKAAKGAAKGVKQAVRTPAARVYYWVRPMSGNCANGQCGRRR